MFNVEKLQELTEKGLQKYNQNKQEHNSQITLQKEDPEKFFKEFLKDTWRRAKESASEGSNALFVGAIENEDLESGLEQPDDPHNIKAIQLKGLARRMYEFFDEKELSPTIQYCDECGQCPYHKNTGYKFFISWRNS